MTLAKELHPEKVDSLIEVIPFGSSIVVKEEQFLNADSLILITFEGIETIAKLLHFSNADFPIETIPAGSFKLVRASHPLKEKS